MTRMESLIRSEEKTFKIEEELVMVQVLVMKDSYLVWVGQVNPDNIKTEFNQLALAMINSKSNGPVGTTLINPTIENRSEVIAKKLSQRFKKQFFLSFNLKQTEPDILQTVETKIFDFVNQINIK